MKTKENNLQSKITIVEGWSKSDLNIVLIANSESRGKMLHIPQKNMYLGALCVELWLKQVLYIIFVPMSYISFFIRLIIIYMY